MEEKQEDTQPEEELEIFLSAVTPTDIIDDSCKTFIFKNEGHTLGNSLRFVISHYPDVKFCGHTIPHPAENEMHLRIQTAGGVSAVDVLRKGLEDLDLLCDHTESVFEKAMEKWLVDNPDSMTEPPDAGLFHPPAPPGPKI